MKFPPVWSPDELQADAAVAVNAFRAERIDEPVERWRTSYLSHQQHFRQLFDLFEADNPGALAPVALPELIKSELKPAFRYLAAPPISDDDLQVLADVSSMSPQRLAQDAGAAGRVIDAIVRSADPIRFPWLAENRLPTTTEREFAIMSSALLLTAQRVVTDRRSEGKNQQEEAVRTYLRSIGLVEVPPRAMPNMSNAPAPGEFCRESLVASRKADVIARLFDGRLLAIECKVSNSSTNSVKRLNNDAAKKAVTWLEELGRVNIVPMAVLSGVFKLKNLQQAQSEGLVLIWAHRFGPLGDFILSTK
jgi:hypothetical protein